MDLRHAPDILNTQLHSSQKQSKTTTSVGLETIELSDLIINIDLPPDVLTRYTYKIIHVWPRSNSLCRHRSGSAIQNHQRYDIKRGA